MVVTGSGMTVYIYLPDPTNPPQSACTGDCANDWPPVLLSTTTPNVDGIGRARVGVLTRSDGSRQLTLNGYPLYRYAADRRPGDTRGESVGNTWFAIDPSGNLLALTPATFGQPRRVEAQPLQVIATPAGGVVSDSNGQTVYIYKDDTPTSTACTAAWCVQDWPPLLVYGPPAAVGGISAQLGVLRRPDGTLQLTAAGHPLYRFSGDQRPGDVRGEGIGGDWFAVAPDGSKVVTSPPSST
jgi:predicted lipoprotein with Yx(FWY)xxD motif